VRVLVNGTKEGEEIREHLEAIRRAIEGHIKRN
jgi:hypothetical protein